MREKSDKTKKTLILEVEELRRQLALSEQLVDSLQGGSSAIKDKIIAELPVGLSITDESGQCIIANEAMGQMIGATKEDVLKQNYNDLESWKKSGLLDKVRSAAKRNSKELFEISVRSTFGKDLILKCHIIPFLAEEKKYMLFMMEDVTSQRKAEEELKMHRNRLDELVRERTAILNEAQRIARVGSFELDIEKNSATISEEASRIYGVDQAYFEEDAFDKFIDLVTSDDRTRVNEAYEGALREKKDIEIEHGIVTPDDEKKTLITKFMLIYNETGLPKTIRGIMQDITERKRVETEVLKVEKLESIGQLAGGIAHDFNNVLTVIMNDLEYIRLHGANTGDALARLKEAQSITAKAKGLAHQLLTFSKGGAPLKNVVSMGTIIRESVTFFLSGSAIKQEIHIARDLWSVEADKGQMEQVFNNLILNSKQAMAGKGTVSVTAENFELGERTGLPLPPGRYVKIVFEDNGPGIKREYQGRIFDPFFSTKDGGTGLGLSTTYSIVKKHGGHIVVHSHEGKGTAFDIYIPATDKEVEKTETKRREMKGRGKVLIIEDEIRLGKVMCTLLADFGYEAELSCDGSEGIKIFKAALAAGAPFDAVVLDLTIPGGIGGKETIAKLLDIDRSVKAVVTSGYSTDPVMAEYEKYGFSAALPKPYSVDDLAEVLTRMLFAD